jgi:hypothetical protein
LPVFVQIAQLTREAVVSPTASADIDALVREAIRDGPGFVDVAATVREVLLDGPRFVSFSQLVRETVIDGLGPLVSIGTITGSADVQGKSPIESVGTIFGKGAILGIGAEIVKGKPLPGPTTLQSVIKSYLYVQFNDDDHLLAMVEAYNAYAQSYIDYLNALNLPIYTSDPVSGALLDWVGTNLYGYPRPGIPIAGKAGEGPYNTYQFNSLTINGDTLGQPSSFTPASDDVYRRVLTWHFYKGDGHQFTTPWLKRRITRFLNGPNGTDILPGAQTYDVSVTFTGPRAAVITLANTPIAAIFQALAEAGILELPFQIDWTINLS